MQKIVSLCRRRGFIYPSSEIYGGIANTWDYGPLGVELKNNIKRAWWRDMVQSREDMIGQDAAILMNLKTWEASGHVENFTDPLVDCRSCKKRFRADHLIEKYKTDERGVFSVKDLTKMDKIIERIKCPHCGGELTDPRQFNLMFETFIGPIRDKSSRVYLRPETAQGIFVNFLWLKDAMRKRLPFGVAQIGKSFRNEITAGNFTFRTLEFEQMEMEYFVEPGTDEQWHQYWLKERWNWYLKHGLTKEKLRLRPHKKEELSHYAKACSDIEYKFPFGWSEIEGIANRQDYDLKQHSKHSGKDLRYFDEKKHSYYFPYVIEPSGGVDRAVLAFLVDAYQEVKGGRTKTTEAKKETEIVLKLHKKLAPVKAAVLPLVKNKPELVKKAKEVYQLLKPYFVTQYDEVDSIGRRYRRQDEIGTLFCLTVDFESLKKNDLTVRDRDTMEQKRVKIKNLVEVIREKLED